jgi:hypothetical protein
MILCDNCKAIITDENCQTVDINHCVCDSCEADLCSSCVGEFNECPVCGKEITFEENF